MSPEIIVAGRVTKMFKNLPKRIRSSSQFPRVACAVHGSPDSLRHVTLHQLHRTTFTICHSPPHEIRSAKFVRICTRDVDRRSRRNRGYSIAKRGMPRFPLNTAERRDFGRGGRSHETARSAVNCKLPSTACDRGTPPKVINPHFSRRLPLRTPHSRAFAPTGRQISTPTSLLPRR